MLASLFQLLVTVLGLWPHHSKLCIRILQKNRAGCVCTEKDTGERDYFKELAPVIVGPGKSRLRRWAAAPGRSWRCSSGEKGICCRGPLPRGRAVVLFMGEAHPHYK